VSLEDRLYSLLSLYDRLPQPMRRVVGRSYAHLPVSWRLGTRYAEFKELALGGERWSLDEACDYQLQQLRTVLRHAADSCAFYRQRFAEAGFDPRRLESLDDMARCPLLEKRDLQEHLPTMVSTAFPSSARLYITTGGSTGVPVGFYLHRGVSRPKEQAFLATMWERAGYREGARLAVIRGYVTSERAEGRIVSYDATRDWLMLSSYHLTRDRLDEYLEALERFRPDFLHAYPSAALQLAEYLDESGHTWRLPLEGVLCGSEQLTISQKRLLERVFGTRVYRWYGHSERVVLAAEGTRSELFYFLPQYGFVEFGPARDDGAREVIGTSFHSLVMPLIRYRTGDYVRLADGDATQREFPWPAASEVAGRAQEFLVSALGRRISLTAFNMHDDVFDDLYGVQFYQEEPGVAEFRFVPTPRFNRSRLPVMERRLRHKLGDDFRVTMREVRDLEKTPRGKHRWLVSRLAASGAGTTTDAGERTDVSRGAPLDSYTGAAP
jgi:phenylacetate-CoA ligase